MIGELVTSKAGHDKEQLYIIVKEEKEFVFLADGDGKTIEHPKRKNRKHIQPIKFRIQQELIDRMEAGQKVYPEEIRRQLKLYRISCQGEN